ncbi:Carbonic anhydrase 1 [Frankliniella fusca]|uniref:Carbonic anhydrase 1 n=1 Tax=Frankliniella fusca TaxID=407009 RepID=A0AAE1L9Y2_9NEOP|nr:Carbonic anhydrase 1 [Frankliniella fusca]
MAVMAAKQTNERYLLPIGADQHQHQLSWQPSRPSDHHDHHHAANVTSIHYVGETPLVHHHHTIMSTANRPTTGPATSAVTKVSTTRASTRSRPVVAAGTVETPASKIPSLLTAASAPTRPKKGLCAPTAKLRPASVGTARGVLGAAAAAPAGGPSRPPPPPHRWLAPAPASIPAMMKPPPPPVTGTRVRRAALTAACAGLIATPRPASRTREAPARPQDNAATPALPAAVKSKAPLGLGPRSKCGLGLGARGGGGGGGTPEAHQRQPREAATAPSVIAARAASSAASASSLTASSSSCSAATPSHAPPSSSATSARSLQVATIKPLAYATKKMTVDENARPSERETSGIAVNRRPADCKFESSSTESSKSESSNPDSSITDTSKSDSTTPGGSRKLISVKPMICMPQKKPVEARSHAADVWEMTGITELDWSTSTASSPGLNDTVVAQVAPASGPAVTPPTSASTAELDTTTASSSSSPGFNGTLTLHTTPRSAREVDFFLENGVWPAEDFFVKNQIWPPEDFRRRSTDAAQRLQRDLYTVQTMEDRYQACLEYATKGTVAGRKIDKLPKWMLDVLES